MIFTEEEKIEWLESELALCRERLGPGGITMLLELKECRNAHHKRIEELEERLFHETANRLAIESAFKESQSREAELREALDYLVLTSEDVLFEKDRVKEIMGGTYIGSLEIRIKKAKEALASTKPAILAVVEECERFKASFDRGFPNSLNAIDARDKMFGALTEWKRGGV